MVKIMKIFLRLNKMMLLFFILQVGISNCKEQDNENKLKEECEQLIIYYESYKNAYNSNPNNIFIKEVLLALIAKIDEKLKDPISKKILEDKIDLEKTYQLKKELLIDKYKSKALII